MQDLLTLVLAGGKGDRLWPLTRNRAKPVVPFLGRRLIDFTLGNCARSRIREVLVLTQYLFEPHRPAQLENVVVGGRVERSVLGSGVRVEHHAEVRDSVLLDGVVVGPSARLRRVVAEEGVRVPAGAEIGFCPARDRACGHVTREGLVVLTKGVRGRVPLRV